MPWRTPASETHRPDPYHVWVSEIMLQQTRVEAVKAYYARFLTAFPNIKSLANAPQDELMKLWQGLGYYSRANNLKRAAIEIEERFHGESENSCIYLGYKSDAYYKKKQKMHPEITCEKLEYVYVGAEFNRKILKYGGIMIHSSAV